MNIVRFVCASIAFVTVFSLPLACQAAEAEITVTEGKDAAKKPLSVSQAFNKIRADLIRGEFTRDEMLKRIDQLVIRIDQKIEGNPTNAEALKQIRSATLQMRSQVVRHGQGNGTQLIQITQPTLLENAVGENVMGGEGLLSENVMPDLGLGQGPISGGGAAGSTGGVSGASGAAGTGGIAGGAGGLGLLGGIAAAISVPLAGDDDSPGPPASPSE